jgi:glycosyltransferase involved in cell wall biosynthesis
MTKLEVLEPEKNMKKFADDPLLSFIVPVYEKDPMVFKRCLMSLADQDYENKEVIVVFDGQDKKLLDIANQFLSKGFFKIIEIEHVGACEARNAGFRCSKGEIVSFFNSDYIAKPGMARMWVDKLVQNPDYGFVYGGYEYATSNRWVYPSKPFDPWQLEVANYIDCGFPLWRKYAVEWDHTVKSLQDWDFWLRVIKTHNIKGYYLGRDYSFIAEAPRPKGLSEDSSSNWIDRVRYIKVKNNIPQRDILVASLGAQNHAVEIAKLIDADYRDDTFDKPSEYKALYMIGFFINSAEGGMNEHSRRLAMFKDRYPKAKRIVHFVGTDIYWLRKFPYESLKYLSGALRLSCDHILSENLNAQIELKEMGIPSEIVPIPSYTSNWQVKPLPKEFKVGMYLVEPGRSEGQSDYDKYCYEHMLSIVRGMPDVQFTGYGKGGWDVQYPNLKHYKTIPRSQWPDYVYDNSALLRIVRHDTKPLASNEFMLAGRDVISNIPGECTDYIDTTGKHELNEWDIFSEGFSAHNWPKTKKNIIQTIRKVKKRFLTYNERVALSKKLEFMQDHGAYKNKIRELCNV